MLHVSNYYYIIICIINLSDAVMLDGAYDKGKALPADLYGHVICCSLIAASASAVCAESVRSQHNVSS